MSVIKTLDASENNEEREREKLKIEKEFKKSDKKLQELVGEHDSELTKVNQHRRLIELLLTNDFPCRRCSCSQKSRPRSISHATRCTRCVRTCRLANTC